MTKKVIIDDHTPHYVVVPLMAQGHMIPMIDLAQRLAERGVLTTVITTPFNAGRIKTTIERAKESGLPIRFIPLQFPCAEVGLPEGCENIDVLPSGSLEISKKFFEATTLLARPLEAYLRENHPYPSCIISDSCHPWTLEVTRSLGIPRLAFFSICCFTLLCEYNNIQHKVLESINEDTKPFLVPGLAHKIEVTRAQAPGFFTHPFEKMGEDIRKADEASFSLVVNSFYELESWYVDSYKKAVGKEVWVLGPLSLCNKEVADMAGRGNAASIDGDTCLSWLDSMKPSSVVYVSFGSLARSPPSQVIEIGLGLEASGCPFIWAMKEADSSPEVERWLSLGFKERTRARGLIIKGWAPQVMILSHPAVGGFVTHCGWNSSLESVAAGVPMITWPFFADQFLNEKMIVEVLRTGVDVGVKAPCFWAFGLDDIHMSVIKRDKVEKAVRRVMGEGVEAEERRERARELGRIARRAVEEGGSSHLKMTQMMESISQITCGKHREEEKDL